MRYVTLDEVKPGDQLAMEIYDSYGRILLDKGKTLTSEYISVLGRYGLVGVYVSDPLSYDIEVDSLITGDVRSKGITCVKEHDVDGCAAVALDIVDELLEKDEICLEFANFKTYDDFTYYHSVNVALYACAIGAGMKLSKDALVELTTAGMLHDFGKSEIPQEILNKNGRLTQDEFEFMKSHSRIGYEIIKDTNLSTEIKEAVLSHHENVDGTGYPNGTTGAMQSLYTKILHVADVYDALTSNRPYKSAYSTSDAIEYMMGACNIQFDQKVVEVLAHHVPLYPRGHKMKLSDGRYCIIAENQGIHNMRPVIKFMDGSTLDLHDPRFQHITITDTETSSFSFESEVERQVMIGSRRKPTLLLVDDMKTNLETLREILKDDYNCILLKSGAQAVDYIKKQSIAKSYPALILMDIDMPEMNGIDATKKINQETAGVVPTLFVTGLSDKETVLGCREVGAAGYILKPYSPIYIKSEISRILTGIDVTQ